MEGKYDIWIDFLNGKHELGIISQAENVRDEWFNALSYLSKVYN